MCGLAAADRRESARSSRHQVPVKTRPVFALPLLLLALAISARAAVPDAALIERLTGLKGAANEAEGVFKVTKPRADLPVSVEARVIAPFAGFTSWAAFNSGGPAEAMVMGDLVLLEDEMTPVLKSLRRDGVNIVAIHHHMLHETPRMLFLHYYGRGSAASLGAALKRALVVQAAVKPKAVAP